MIIGETLCADETNFTIAYSPWFTRLGDAAEFVLEVIATADVDLEVKVQTKNSEDADPTAGNGLAPGGSITMSGSTFPATFKNQNTGLKELVRFEYNVEGTESTLGYVHFRMLNPAWITN